MMYDSEEMTRNYRAGITAAALAALDVIQRLETNYYRQSLLVCELWDAVEQLGCDSKNFWDARTAHRDAREK